MDVAERDINNRRTYEKFSLHNHQLVEHLLVARLLNTFPMVSLFEHMHYDVPLGEENVCFAARWFETCRPPVD